jgi:hypothetical protein
LQAILAVPTESIGRSIAAPGLRGRDLRLNRGSRDGICTAVAASDRAVAILNGEIPAVFINGVGKANPSAEEVLAEFERTR